MTTDKLTRDALNLVGQHNKNAALMMSRGCPEWAAREACWLSLLASLPDIAHNKPLMQKLQDGILNGASIGLEIEDEIKRKRKKEDDENQSKQNEAGLN